MAEQIVAERPAIQITRHRTIRGQKLPKFTAKLGAFEAEGDTKAAAHAAVIAEVERASFAHRYLFTNDGEILVVYFAYGSWCYDIVRVGQSYPCSCSGAPTMEECVRRATAHAEQSYGGLVAKAEPVMAGA